MAAEADAEPAANADGEIWVIAGMGLLICRLIEPVEMLVPPLLATIDAVPAVASWLVGMTAVTCVLLTEVVGSETPASSMTVEGVNPVPVIVTVVAALPASMVRGEIELIIGVAGGGVEVEDPELPLEQPETRHVKDTQIAAIHPPNLFGIDEKSSV
jgi:hypothetical protein